MTVTEMRSDHSVINHQTSCNVFANNQLIQLNSWIWDGRQLPVEEANMMMIAPIPNALTIKVDGLSDIPSSPPGFIAPLRAT